MDLRTLSIAFIALLLAVFSTTAVVSAAAQPAILNKKAISPTHRNIRILKQIALSGSLREYRARALHLLAAMRNVRTLMALSEILKKTDDDQLRAWTAMALTRLPNHRGYRTLEYGTSLPSSPSRVRISCLKALSMTLKKGITHMLNLLLRDREYRIRYAAAAALPLSATRYNIYHMNRLLKNGSTIEMKRAVARGMLALNSRRTRSAARAAIQREKDTTLLKILLEHLLKSGGSSKTQLQKWSADSGKPSAFRSACAAAMQ